MVGWWLVLVVCYFTGQSKNGTSTNQANWLRTFAAGWVDFFQGIRVGDVVEVVAWRHVVVWPDRWEDRKNTPSPSKTSDHFLIVNESKFSNQQFLAC